MNILIYCPYPTEREAIAHHIIELGNYQQLYAETEQLVVSLALYNPIALVLLFDPPHSETLVELAEFLRNTRRKMKVRILPDQAGELMPGWREGITSALRPAKKRKSRRRNQPRFEWKPNN